MKKVFLSALAVTVIALSFTSCSVEKRHYMNGYHLEWFGDKKDAKDQATVKTTKAVVAEESAVAVQEESQISPVAPATEIAPVQKSVAAPVALAKTKTVAAKSVSANSVVSKSNNNGTVAAVKSVVKQGKKEMNSKPASDKPSKGLLILLAILIPWLAVGLATDWEVKPLIINLLLSLTCIGAIIHAIVIVNRNA